MTLQQLIMLAFQVSIFLTVFGFGLKATTDDLLFLVRRPLLLTRSLLSMFVVMPVVALLITAIFSLPRTTEIELVALAISAVPPLLPGKEGRAGVRTSYGLGLMLTVAVLSFVIIPASIHALGWYSGRPLTSALDVVSGLVFRMMLLPVVAGMAVRAFLPAVAQRSEKPVTWIARVLLTVAALALLAGLSRAVWALVGDGTVLAMALFVVAGLAAGHILAGPKPEDSAVLALSTACRHPGMAVGIAAANSPDLNPGPPTILYLIVSGLICLPYIAHQRRRIAAAASAVRTEPATLQR